MRCKIRLRDVVRSVSCISGEAEYIKRQTCDTFCFRRLRYVNISGKVVGSGWGCTVFPSFWFDFQQLVLRFLLSY